MANELSELDMKFNGAMKTASVGLIAEGWQYLGGTAFGKEDKPYELALLTVYPGAVPKACEIGGIKWNKDKGEPAVYVMAHFPNDTFRTELSYLKQVRFDEDPFVAGIKPDVSRLKIYSLEDPEAYYVFPLELATTGPLLGIGLADSEGDLHAIAGLDELDSVGEVIENPYIEDAAGTLAAAKENYELAVRRLEPIAQIQQILHFSQNKEGSKNKLQAQFLYGSVARLAPDGRDILMKLLSFGAEDGMPTVTGTPFITARRHTPYLESYDDEIGSSRPQDEYGLAITPTSPETLGRDIADVTKGMLHEYEIHPPKQPAIMEMPDELPPGTLISTKKVPLIMYT